MTVPPKPPPAKSLAPPPPRGASSAPGVPSAPIVKAVTFGNIAKRVARRIGLYGTGGSGKTTLAAHAPGPIAYVDLDDSLPVLDELHGLPLQIINASDWKTLLGVMRAKDGWDGIRSIVIDPLTKAEELCVAETIATVPHEKGLTITRLEDYGFGKGLQHVYDTFLPLLAALDQHVRAGRNVILLMHDCTTNVPNPAGEDWIRYEPRLQSPNSGKASIRLRVKEWLDDLLFLGYDVNVNKDGKGQGKGTRTVYPVESPMCMAKSRQLSESIPIVKHSTELWDKLFDRGGN